MNRATHRLRRRSGSAGDRQTAVGASVPVGGSLPVVEAEAQLQTGVLLPPAGPQPAAGSPAPHAFPGMPVATVAAQDGARLALDAEPEPFESRYSSELESSAGENGARSAGRTDAGPARSRRVELVGLAVTVAGVLLALFLLYLYVFSALTAARNQNVLLHSLTGDPKAAFSLASGNEPPDGGPVAVLDIPDIGLHQAVVEGTSAADLQKGPGLVRSRGLSGLPGEPGDAIIAGRRVSFGGPFARLGDLKPGDSVHVVDGAGSFVFSVTSVGTVSQGSVTVPSYGRSWLTLVTSNSSWLPSGRLVVTARIVGRTASSGSSAVSHFTIPSFTGDPASGILAALWAMVFVAVLALMIFTIRRWRQPWISWLLAAPVLLACGLFACESLARCLPSTL